MHPVVDDPRLDTDEAAAYLGVSPLTLCHWRATGRYGLQYTKIGTLVRYRKSVLDKFLEERTYQHTGEQRAAATEALRAKKRASRRVAR